MSNTKIKPTRWYYVLALLIPLFACLGTSLLVYLNVPEFPGAFGSMSIDNLNQVIAPGSEEVYFPKAGAYAVYYEYRSVIDGVSYTRDEYPPSMRCELRSKATGKNVKLVSSNIKGNIYTSHFPERAGVVYKIISIDQPGDYIFSCQYKDGRTDPEIVLAVGPNILYEFLNAAAKPIAASIVGSFAFAAACGLSILIIGVVAFKRYQSNKTIAHPGSQTG